MRKILFIAICLIFLTNSEAQVVRYVKPVATGSANGSSWANASSDIQDMISASSVGDMIWVAAGTYKPTKDPFGNASPSDPRDKTFYLKNQVRVYGGFNGTETSLGQRNWQTNVTILSGDIGVVNSNNDNSYHVVVSVADAAATIIDGFTVTAGNANGIGGLTIEGVSVSTERVDGGGMINTSSSPTIMNCTFTGNAAILGGGMSGLLNSSYDITDCIFSANSADYGGGMYVHNGTSVTISSCVFSTNTAAFGGGIYKLSAALEITNSFFSGNSATGGGGLFNTGSSLPITNCVFTGNQSNFGAGIYNDHSTSSIVNCVFSNNAASSSGSGIYNVTSPLVKIDNCIIRGSSSITNAGGTPAVTYSNIEGGYAGTGNINADPLFVNAVDPDGPDNTWGTTDDGLSLLPCSPSIDAGNSAAIILTTDAAGQARKFDVPFISNTGSGTPPVDMGAYENQTTVIPAPPAGILYVNTSLAAGNDDGASWTNAFRGADALQKALNIAFCRGNEIWVAAGTYKPSKDPFGNTNPADPRDKTFYLLDGVKIYGGFNGTETAIGQRNWHTNITTLSGDIGGAGNTDNCYHVLVSVSDGAATVLDGFTITAGNANGTGGFVLEGSGITTFRSEGGGIHNAASSLAIANCVYSGNVATEGGGMNNTGSSPVITSCVFSGNAGNVLGGGMNNTNSTPVLRNCVFAGNATGGDGAGMINTTSSATITNCSFWNNSASSGGGIYNISSSPVLTNCIIRGSTGGSIINITGSNPVVTYSNIEGGYAGTGNINADPVFVNAADPDGADNIWGTTDDGLSLSPCSPSVDAGNSAAIALTTDAAGQPRKFDVPFIPNTGSGTPPVDMGAYENQVTTVVTGIVYVNTGLAAGNNDGSSWANAYRGADALQKALDNIYCQGNEIWVAAGMYKPTKDPFNNPSPADPRDKTFYLRDGVKIYGGFNGTETSLGQRNWKTNVTILSGDIGTVNVSADNCYHVVVSVNDGAATTLDGFTVTAGNANGLAWIELENSFFFTYRNEGGGMNNVGSRITVSNCVFSGNTSSARAGGMYNGNSLPSVIIGCVFSGNTASNGGGMYNFSSSPVIANCIFSGNTAGNNGGGINNDDFASPPTTNCVFYGNTAIGSGGGFYNLNFSSPAVINCIIRGSSGGSIVNGTNSNSNVTYSNIEGGYAGTGNINTDPLFVNTADPDGPDNTWGTTDDGLSLLPCSPSIDAGNSAAITLTTDAAGQTRKFDVPFVPNTGNGTPPVDMGAYENQSSGIMYVNTSLASGNDNGSSWANAFRGADALQKALDIALCPGIEIWVAAGTYKPAKDPFGNTSPANARDKTFYLRNGVKIYGGFTGTETSLTQRNWKTNLTILSGEIDAAGIADNSYHTVISVSDGNTTALDGFTITGGNANGTGGFVLEGSGITTFRNEGGGMHNAASSPVIANCIFSGNTATDGGGMNNTGSSPAVTNCVFAGNAGNASGGGMNNTNSTPSLQNCVFAGNATGGDGAGMINTTSSATITNCNFWNNSANSGGGIYNISSSPVLTNCIIRGSTGGSIINITGSNPVVTYSNIEGGYAGTGNINADPVFVNAADPDGADNIWGTTDDGLRLSDCSLSVDAGNSGAIALTTDAAGQPRKFDVPFVLNTGIGTPPVDMGAYENQSAVPSTPPIAIVYVNTSLATGNNDGSSWANAYRGADALQKALDGIYCRGNEIWVAAGTYKPTKDPFGNTSPANPRDKTFYLQGGVKIYGGFNGTEMTLGQRNWKTNVTILSGDIGTVNVSTDNCYHVVVSVNDGAATALDGFTVSAGNANGSGGFILEGSGIATFRGEGAGMNSILSSMSVANCTFSVNTTNFRGGGIHNTSSSPVITSCVFSGNTADEGGSMYNISNSSPIINNCIFSGNAAGSNGGGVANDGSSPAITNCVFSGNTAANFGGGLYNLVSSPTIINCSFTGNTASSGGSMHNFFDSSPSITNCITRGGNIINTDNSTPVITYSNIEGGYPGTGNINADPLFVNAADPDGADNIWGTADDGLKLQCGSPSIDAGSNSSIPAGITTDITGAARILNGTVDMGAYENNLTVSNTITSVNMSDIRNQSGITTYGNCAGLIALVNSTGTSPIAGSTTASVWIETSQPAQFVKRHYQITPVANAATATGRITLYFTQAEFNAFNAVNSIKLPTGPADASGISNLLVEKRAGTSSDGSGLPGTYSGSIININPADADIVWNSGQSRWEISFDVTGFSGFFVKVISNPLPVKWLNVKGRLNAQQQAVISWEVQETNVAYYEVEKSTDGISFNNTGRVPGRGDGQHEYNFTDASMMQGDVFYRIRQVDMDGRSSYSSIIKLSNKTSTRLSVYPIPFKEGFTVVTSKTQTAVLLDANGRLIKTIVLEAGSNYVPCGNISAGMYLLRTADGEVQKLIRE